MYTAGGTGGVEISYGTLYMEDDGMPYLQLRLHRLGLPSKEQRDNANDLHFILLEHLTQRGPQPLLRVRRISKDALLVVQADHAGPEPGVLHSLREDCGAVHDTARRERGDDGAEDVRRLRILRERAGEAVEKVVERDRVVLAAHVLCARRTRHFPCIPPS